MFGILGIVVVSNVLEIKRNSSKQWTLLKSEEAQAQFRSELCSKLKATSVVRYTTNYGNQLFADTGLSYWDVRDSTEQIESQTNIYIDFDVDQNKTLSLGSIEPQIPVDYSFQFQIGDYKIYRRQNQ